MVTWNNAGKITADEGLDLSVDDMKRSLELIKKHSIFKTEAALAEQFDSLTSRTGTRIVVFRLKRLEMRNLLELSFNDKQDIQLTQDTPTEKGGEYVHPALYSLREYCKVLYLEPKLMIYIRGRKVRSARMIQELYYPKQVSYKPQKFVDDDGVKLEARIVYGFNKRSKREYGMMLYQKNRLIRFFVPVGMQKLAASRGRGVLIIVSSDIRAHLHTDCCLLHRLTRTSCRPRTTNKSSCATTSTEVSKTPSKPISRTTGTRVILMRTKAMPASVILWASYTLARGRARIGFNATTV